MMVACNQDPALEGLRVLIVDDDVDSCDLLMLTLESHAMEAQVAFSASEALKAFVQFQPDVLVSDIAMPYEDGYSLIRKVRQLETDEKVIPAIAVTAMAREEVQTHALTSGFDRWIVKPFDPNELITAIANLVSQACEEPNHQRFDAD